jgi:hypothetical protein
MPCDHPAICESFQNRHVLFLILDLKIIQFKAFHAVTHAGLHLGECFEKSMNIYLQSNFAVKLLDQDSSVSIVTHYGLDGPGIESQWR